MTNADIVITVAKVLGNKNSRDGIFVPGSESYHGNFCPEERKYWGAKSPGLTGSTMPDSRGGASAGRHQRCADPKIVSLQILTRAATASAVTE